MQNDPRFPADFGSKPPAAVSGGAGGRPLAAAPYGAGSAMNSSGTPLLGGGGSSSSTLLEDASYEELAEAVAARLAEDRGRAAQRLAEVEAAEKSLQEKKDLLEEMEQRIFATASDCEEVVDLNVGGQPMSTTRAALCSAEGSLLAGMFSGNFDAGHKRDKEGRIFLDVDPTVFSKLLSHLRLRRIASPECPAPLPLIPEDLRPEYEMLVKYFGLENFMYGDVGPSGNVFQRISELTGVCQSKMQTKELIRIMLSSTGGVPATNHEEVFGPVGFHERSLENSYGANPNTITVKFLKHRVRVEGMELRAKAADVVAHMSNTWTFKQGVEAAVHMSYPFSRQDLSTGRLPVASSGNAFWDEITWTFPRDFCLEHIVLFGRVVVK